MLPWSVLGMCAVHLFWGVSLLFSDTALHVTPLAHFQTAQFRLVGLGYVVSALLSLWGLRVRGHFQGLLLALPQQFLVLISAAVVLMTVTQGVYPDGYVPAKYGSAHLFILSDQLLYLAFAAIFTASLLDYHGLVGRPRWTSRPH